jgi:hypothetical protein
LMTVVRWIFLLLRAGGLFVGTSVYVGDRVINLRL